MINKKILLDIYKTFSLIRASQNELISTYHPENKMRCPIHFCQGQEALASVAKIFFRKMFKKLLDFFLNQKIHEQIKKIRPKNHGET